MFITDVCPFPWLADTNPRSSLQQHGIETKKASKTESCGKSSEGHCGVQKTEAPMSHKNPEKNTIHIFDINFGWGHNPNRGHYSNAVQQILANIESHRVSVDDLDRKCIGAMATRSTGVTWVITPLPRSRVLEHLEDSLSAQDDSD